MQPVSGAGSHLYPSKLRLARRIAGRYPALLLRLSWASFFACPRSIQMPRLFIAC